MRTFLSVIFLISAFLFLSLVLASFLPPTPFLSRQILNFAAEKGGLKTDSQKITIEFLNRWTGARSSNPWKAKAKSRWLRFKPTAGRGRKIIYVQVWSYGLEPGLYRDSIIFFNPQSQELLAQVQVNLRILAKGSTSPPFGHIDWPVDGAKVSRHGFYATGWALDDIGVEEVELRREPLSVEEMRMADTEGLIFLGRAPLFEDARPDVEKAFPDMPWSYRAGWGISIYPFLFSKETGEIKIYFFVRDKEGNKVKIGQRTVLLE